MSVGRAFLMSRSDVSVGRAFMTSRSDVSAVSIFASCVDQDISAGKDLHDG